MKLTIIEGRSGAGKTAWCCGEIAEKISRGQPCYYIVPEQLTYEMELTLMHALGGGLLGVEVLSLPRLARKVLSAAGGGVRSYLSGEGKRMALRKVISENKGKLGLFGGAREYGGLAEKLGAQIALLKRGEIDPALLRQRVETLSDPLLKGKMQDLATVYEGMNAFMEGRYIDGEDQQALLIQRIPQAEFLAGSAVYVDAFFGHQYTEQAYHILAALLERCGELNVCLRTPSSTPAGSHGASTSSAGGLDEDADIFIAEIQARDRLRKMGAEMGLSPETGDLMRLRLPEDAPMPGTGRGGERHFMGMRPAPPAVKVLEQSLYAYRSPGDIDGTGLGWYEAPSREDELRRLAEGIDVLLRSGVRAREIAVAVGNLEAYAPLIRKALAGLPLYLDEKRPLASHGIVGLTLAALRCADRGVTLADVTALVASGLSGVKDEDGEALENYALAYGMQYRGWKDEAEFARGAEEEPALYAAALRARNAILKPIQALARRLRADKTAAGLCRALFHYYEEIQLRQALEDFCRQWEEDGEIEIAAECAQVWQLTLALLDQVALLMDGPMTISRFIEVLEEGFKAQMIGMVPALTDQISVGDVARLASRGGIQHLFLLGCTEGDVPQNADSGGMIDDEDIAKLEAVGISAFQSSGKASAYQRQCVYALCARAEASLTVSWARCDAEGNALFPSMVAERVQQLFPKEKLPPPSLRPDRQPSPAAGFRRLVGALNTLADATTAAASDPGAASVLGAAPAYGYFARNEDWADTLREVNRRLFPAPPRLDADASSLFARWYRSNAPRPVSVTRLEAFNQCPFRHMVQYGLRPQPRREWREENRDVGNYYHEALDLFTRRVMAGDTAQGDGSAHGEAAPWTTLTEEEITGMLDEILAELSVRHNAGIFQESARGRAQAKTLRENLIHTAVAMVAQIRGGKFTPVYSEAEIGDTFPALALTLRDGSQVELVGKIDRIDRYEGSHGTYIRIVDYKSGGMDFSFEELYHGLKLQLPLYLLAAQSLGEAGGMFYLHIQSASAEEDGDWGAGEEDGGNADAGSAVNADALQRSYRLRGILLGEPEVLEAMDRNLAPGESSLHVPVKLKADGSPDSRSSKVLPAGEMQLALHYARDKAAETAERIQAGDTEIAPFKSRGRDACQWCEYRSVCRFEPGRGGRYRKLKKMDKKGFFEDATS